MKSKLKTETAWGLYGFNGQTLVSVCVWRGKYDESARSVLELEWTREGFTKELGFVVKKITVIDDEPDLCHGKKEEHEK